MILEHRILQNVTCIMSLYHGIIDSIWIIYVVEQGKSVLMLLVDCCC